MTPPRRPVDPNALLFGAVAVLFLLALYTSLAHGQASLEATLTHACVADCAELHRVMVAEAGFDAHRSHAAAAHVLGRYAVAQGVSLTAAADTLVWAFSNAQVDRPWLRYLTPACARPDYWRGRWEPERCLRVAARALAFIRNDLPDPCRGKADGWRTRGRALRLALRRGHKRVRCVGGTSLGMVRS